MHPRQSTLDEVLTAEEEPSNKHQHERSFVRRGNRLRRAGAWSHRFEDEAHSLLDLGQGLRRRLAECAFQSGFDQRPNPLQSHTPDRLADVFIILLRLSGGVWRCVWS